MYGFMIVVDFIYLYLCKLFFKVFIMYCKVVRSIEVVFGDLFIFYGYV